MTNFTIGADPEFVLMKNGYPVSAIPYIRGRKKRPEKITGGTIQADNVNVEINIIPSADEDQFIHNMHGAILGMSKYFKDRFPDINLEPHIRAATYFDLDQLQDREAKTFGCEADYSAWTGSINPRPKSAENGTLRTCGGHIHVGKNAEDHEWLISNRRTAVKAIELICGIPLISLERDYTARERQKLYGSSGCYRAKPYGLEYRLPTSTWCSHPTLTRLAFVLTQDAMKICNNGNCQFFIESIVRSIGHDNILTIIKDQNTKCAKEITKTSLSLMSSRAIDLFSQAQEIDFNRNLLYNWTGVRCE